VEEMRQKQEAEEEEQTVIWTNKIKFFCIW